MQEFSSDTNSRAVKRIGDAKYVRGAQFAEDGGPMSHPIRPDSYLKMDNFYTGTVYRKVGTSYFQQQEVKSEGRLVCCFSV